MGVSIIIIMHGERQNHEEIHTSTIAFEYLVRFGWGCAFVSTLKKYFPRATHFPYTSPHMVFQLKFWETRDNWVHG